MGEDKKMCEDAKELVLKAKKKLEGKELLTKEEASLLSVAIGKLPVVESMSGIAKVEKSVLNIEDLFEEFNTFAVQSKEKLEGMLILISQGRVPSSSERADLNNAIKHLCEKYESVKSVAKSELSDDEIPEDGSDIGVYYEVLKNSKSIKMRGMINEIKKTLAQFISVQSPIVKYMIALKPIQKEVKSLLDRISNGKISDIDEILEGVEGPELFMKALNCDDLNTDEGNDMLDSLIEDFGYPLYATRGLLSKSYFVPENEEKITANVEVRESKKAEENSFRKTTDSEEEYTSFRMALMEKKIACDDDSFGLLSKEISIAETKKISARIFLNDMRMGNVKALNSIIQLLCNFIILSPELLRIRCNMPEDVANLNLNFLQKKGYIRKYRIIPGGEFYCSSPRLRKSLTYKDAAKFVGVRQLHVDMVDELIEDTSSSAAARMAMLELYRNTTLNHIESEIRQSSFNRSVMREAFIHRTFDSTNRDDVEFLVGAFWTQYEEMDDFSNDLSKLIEDSKNIILFIFATLNLEIAQKIMKEIMILVPGKINSKCVYLFSTESDKYYSYESGIEMKISDIWKLLGHQ